MWKKLSAISILLLIISPAISSAQEKTSKKVIPKIGVTQTVSSPDFDADAKGFEKALAEAGFKEGIHVIYDRQNAQGDVNRSQTIAQRFLNGNMDLIHSIATPSSRAVMKIIKDVPIVFSSVTDPVFAGLIPKTSPLGTKTGTNITGTSDHWPVALQFESYVKFFPKAKKWGTIYNSGDPRSISYIEEMREVAEKLKVELAEVTISNSQETLPAAQFLVGKVQIICITYEPFLLSRTLSKSVTKRKYPSLAGISIV